MPNLFWVSSGNYEVEAQDIINAINNGTFTDTAFFNGSVGFNSAATFNGPVDFNASVNLGTDSFDTITVKGQFYVQNALGSFSMRMLPSLSANRTATFPDYSGTVAMLERANAWTDTQTFNANATFFSTATFSGSITTLGSSATYLGDQSEDIINVYGQLRKFESTLTYYGQFNTNGISANRVYTFQNASGTVAMLEVAQIWTTSQQFNAAVYFNGGTINISDGVDLSLGISTGTRIGTTTSDKIGFWGKTPVTRPSAYTVTNLTIDRSYDANATSTAELADVLGTLLSDLRNMGLIG